MKQPSLKYLVLSIVSIFFFTTNAFADFSKAYEGYNVFQQFCVICHGKNGNGDGPLANKLDTTPADLTDNTRMKKRTDKELNRIIEGTVPHGTTSKDMPRWGIAIPEPKIKSLTAYIRYMHSGPHTLPGNPGNGKQLYDAKCVICHGPEGEGDGILTKVFSMEPADHTNTALMDKLSNKYLRRIILDGSSGSTLMPAWSGHVTDNEVDDLISYIRLLAAD